ncbi:Hypothetical predicted protein [Paramuricea clavata]|uniref:Uncharacterized protein n=1 Tax=Paramuricea clavata TaxID=317549 RepID=A0A7D9EJL4_PARCT|nr:Hypothetical predicted protein [Paramuricea clavata]
METDEMFLLDDSSQGNLQDSNIAQHNTINLETITDCTVDNVIFEEETTLALFKRIIHRFRNMMSAETVRNFKKLNQLKKSSALRQGLQAKPRKSKKVRWSCNNSKYDKRPISKLCYTLFAKGTGI